MFTSGIQDNDRFALVLLHEFLHLISFGDAKGPTFTNSFRDNFNEASLRVSNMPDTEQCFNGWLFADRKGST